MTAYTVMSNALVAVGAKPFATTMQAFRDNLIAAFEGDATAVAAGVTLKLRSIERLNAGTTICSRNDTLSSQVISQPQKTAYTFDFMQKGTVRVTYAHTHTGGSTLLIRTRNAVATTLSTDTTNGTTTIDVSVLPGDTITIAHAATNASSASAIDTMRIQTNGEYLWPGSQQRLEAQF